jgi:two-component system cell cycle sensor histidine kinase PleC
MNLTSAEAVTNAKEDTPPQVSADQALTIHQIRERLITATSEEAVAARSKKRQTTQQVRQAREKLTSSTGTRPAFDLELLRIYANNRLSASLAMFLLQVFAAGAMLLWTPYIAVGAWLAGVLISHGVLLLMARQFLSPKGRKTRLKAWMRRFACAEGLHAVAWAAMVPLLGLEQIEAARIFLLVVMILGVAVNTLLCATQPIPMYAGSLPLTFATVGFFALQGGDGATTIAILMPIAQIFFFALGARMMSTSLATLEFRSEKDALFGELEQAKANSDEARRRAEAASLAKSRFLATMSHELRTPLNAILGFSEVMKSEVFGTHVVPAYKEYSSDIHSSGQHLLNLINEILDLSRIEAERYELNEEAVNLAHIAEDCHHLLKLRAKNRGISIKEIYEPNMPLLWADERALRQVALNLLSNAIKFTPQGGEIVLTVGWTSEGGQYLSVRDTGPGIPEDEIPTVLSSFGQGTLAIKTAEQGTGLGLPIVKGLIDLHGGAFSLTSKLREGTQVLVALPPSRVMAALAPMEEDKRQLKMTRVS